MWTLLDNHFTRMASQYQTGWKFTNQISEIQFPSFHPVALGIVREFVRAEITVAAKSFNNTLDGGHLNSHTRSFGACRSARPTKTSTNYVTKYVVEQLPRYTYDSVWC